MKKVKFQCIMEKLPPNQHVLGATHHMLYCFFNEGKRIVCRDYMYNEKEAIEWGYDPKGDKVQVVKEEWKEVDL